MTLRWAWHVFSMELRKYLAYRVDFWMQMVANVGVDMLITYFLWSAVYLSLGNGTLTGSVAGYSFNAMMLYYVCSTSFDRMIRGAEWAGNISKEIYEGTLTRYLIYPVNFLGFKYLSNLAYCLLCSFQFALILAVFFIFVGTPTDAHVTAGGISMGWITVVAASYLYFSMSAILEQVAFWNDSVWSLLVMLRFAVSIFGGAIIPLSFFPSAWQEALHWLPFRLMMGFPIELMMGRTGAADFWPGLALIAAWSLLFTWMSRLVWRRGSYQYSGVGI